MSLNPKSKLGKFTQKVQSKLIFFFIYVGSLIYVWIATGRVWPVVLMHLFFVVIFGFVYFFYELIMFLFSPIFLVMWPLQNYLVRKYLKKNFALNTPAEAVIILGHSNWYTLEGWVKPIFFKNEIKALVKTLRAERRDFSFYPDANFEDVERIMGNPAIKAVYFFGHGNSHSFQLNTDEIVYYCDFNDKKYSKEFVHQIHCGDPYGKSLVDYVVPVENKPKCFFFRKTINSGDIRKELKRREALALKQN